MKYIRIEHGFYTCFNYRLDSELYVFNDFGELVKVPNGAFHSLLHFIRN